MAMTTFLIILLVILMVLVVASLVRGIVAFMKSTKIDLESGEQTDATDMQLTQNKMMFARIKYQALAVVVVAVILCARQLTGAEAWSSSTKSTRAPAMTGPRVLSMVRARPSTTPAWKRSVRWTKPTALWGLPPWCLADTSSRSRLYRIQNDLFDLGADLATPAGDDDDFAPSEMVLRMVAAQTAWLEQAIDAANARLEPLTSFVLPGGSEAAARLHVARAATRRAERAMTAMAEQLHHQPQALAYINRLSDYLFVLARVANDGGRSDVKWVPGANR